MNFHKDTGDSLEPCKHMESMLNRTADGTAPPLIRWYAKSHAARCNRCGNFLGHVTNLLGDLKGLKNVATVSPIDDKLSHERWQSVETSWAEAEK